MTQFKQQYPSLRFHLFSGDTQQVTERLERGLVDFVAIVEEPNRVRYHTMQVPGEEV